ncbi:MAG: glutamate--tRNA ligase [Candidatus Cloacimonadota bacterium]|nr:glutamate--tRNA ligase [Candidatus Cloacimonadota bacterium]
MNKNNAIRVRFAPSPTGYLHVGGLRTALFNYLYAQKTNGKSILRIEDTDKGRFVPGAKEDLMNTLKLLGLSYDEGPDNEGEFGPYVQSARTEIYRKFAHELVERGKAYYCFCSKDRLDKVRKEQREKNQTPMYDGKCRNLSEDEVKEKLGEDTPFVIRLKFPKEGKTVFYDKIRGKVEFNNSEVDDQILMKADGYPTYHLANVVDDHLMKISHVIRGEEWITSVPKHIFLYESFGWDLPKFVHLPLLLNPDKSKLSKRQGDVAVEKYLEKGYLPEAMINFIALLGWHAAGDREIYSLKELEKEFSLNRISKSGAVFDLEKFQWMNGQYMKKLDLDYISEKTEKYFTDAKIDISDGEKYRKVVENGRKRASTLAGIIEHSTMFYEDLQFTDEDLKILSDEKAQKIFSFWADALKNADNLSLQKINDLVKQSQKELEIRGKDFYIPLRLVLFGNCHGPDIPTIVDILGKEMTIGRLKKYL